MVLVDVNCKTPQVGLRVTRTHTHTACVTKSVNDSQNYLYLINNGVQPLTISVPTALNTEKKSDAILFC